VTRVAVGARWAREHLVRAALPIAWTCMLAGCAGDSDLARPERRLFALGKASYADVVARFGPPQRTADVVRNGAQIRVIWYSFTGSPAESTTPGEIPVRVLECDFADGVLVGRIFASSFKSDSTDFDETLALAIRKGATSSEEIEIMMGRPSAYFLPPLVARPATTAVGYFYAPAAQDAGGGGWTFHKSLVVAFDDKDLASDISLTAPHGK